MITPEDHKILSADAAYHTAQAKTLRAVSEMHEATATALNRVLESAVIK